MPRPLRVAIQMDPIEGINIDTDSTFALMLEAQKRGHLLWHYGVRNMTLREGVRQRSSQREERLLARAQPLRVQRVYGAHYTFGDEAWTDLGTMDVILMRQDPPFDMAYVASTHMLEHIQSGTLIVNDPVSVRNAPEKLLVTHFPDLMPPTMVGWDIEAIRNFRREHKDIVVKPLFGNGGAGVFRVKEGDANLAAFLNLHFAHSREPLMFQRYEPAVRRGDKRIILVDGTAVGATNRVPTAGDARANIHVGGRAEKCTLSARDHTICAAIAPKLRESGLIFVGIDVIGEWLTEINVTSPTGIQEIDRFDGISIEGMIWDCIEVRRGSVSQAGLSDQIGPPQ